MPDRAGGLMTPSPRQFFSPRKAFFSLLRLPLSSASGANLSAIAGYTSCASDCLAENLTQSDFFLPFTLP